jgi:predicted alpha/beta hydrolase family esterase
MHLVFIHGANATSDSFNFIEAHLQGRDKTFIQYKSADGFFSNLSDMVDQLQGKEIFIVAHSLGGVYAVHLAEALGAAVKGIVTIATPFNGSEFAIALNLLKPCQLYRDIMPVSVPITRAHKIKLACPLTQIVTTAGDSHLMSASNDGVVTEKSMRARSGATMVEIESGHYEVLMRRQTVEVIQAAIERVQEVVAA